MQKFANPYLLDKDLVGAAAQLLEASKGTTAEAAVGSFVEWLVAPRILEVAVPSVPGGSAAH